MKEYIRIIEPEIEKNLFEQGKIIVLYGPRQVGKTTLAKKLLEKYNGDKNLGYFNCEDFSVRDVLNSGIAKNMNENFGGTKLIVLDEAQSVQDIGLMLKIWIDAYPDANIIATGSSSFELASKLNEPLTGRHYEYFLSPIALEEIAKTGKQLDVTGSLENRLIYGSYPEVLLANSTEKARQKLEVLASSYLYRDVLQFNSIKNSDVLTKILRALAHQVGGEVSYNEIANLVGIDRKTVESYILLLEKAFIIFRVSPLTGNSRDEIKKLRKIYFYDNGILNTIIGNLNGAVTGREMGGLWENLMMSERKKFNLNHQKYSNSYFWRTHSGKEIDLVEEYDNRFYPYEFKYGDKAVKRTTRALFYELYPNSDKIKTINKDNFFDFIAE